MALRVDSVHSRKLVDDTDCKVKKSELNLGIRNGERNTNRRERIKRDACGRGHCFHCKLCGIL